MDKFDIRKALLATAAVTALGLSLPALADAPAASSPSTTPTTSGSPESPTSMPSSAGDSTITSQVQSKLSSMSTLKDADINANTSDGVVTLSGNVQSADEKAQAEAAAKSVKGVKSVDNQLTTGSGSSSGGK